jgi:cytochrome c-type biogenesis protein CcmH/NrfF
VINLKQTVAWLFAAFVMVGSSAAYAVQPDEIMSDQAKESRARDLSRELRCMVCQNQSIDDSEAPLARDLRLLVRERIAAGDSNAQVLDFLVARYGEFVLLKPRLEPHTLLRIRGSGTSVRVQIDCGGRGAAATVDDGRTAAGQTGLALRQFVLTCEKSVLSCDNLFACDKPFSPCDKLPHSFHAFITKV